MNRIIIAIISLVLLTGCSNFTRGVNNSLARGAGDLATTVYLDQTQKPEPSQETLTQISNKVLAFLDSGPANTETLKAGILEKVPIQYKEIANAVISKFTGNIEKDIDVARNFFRGVKSASSYYIR